MNRAVGFFMVVLLLTYLPTTSLRGAEVSSDITCATWNRASEKEKLMYAVGYSVGATHAATTAELRLEKAGLAREVLWYLLPENYRFGAIVLEVDKSCGLAVSKDRSVMTVLEDIARVTNAAIIYEHENRDYEQFLQKPR